MLTVEIKPIDPKEAEIHPLSGIIITLSGKDGTAKNGLLNLGVSDLTDFVGNIERYFSQPRAKKCVFDVSESRFQIICERHKHSMVSVSANSQKIDMVEEQEVILAFKKALMQFYKTYRHRMVTTDGSSDEGLSGILSEFDKEYETFIKAH